MAVFQAEQPSPSSMHISVNKSDLLRELSAAQGVVGRKSTVPILSSFLFEAKGNHLLITATDLDLSLRTLCPATVMAAGACTIPARKLYDYVRLLPEGDLTMKVLENHSVQIRSGRSNTKMVGMARANFPVLPLFPAHAAIKLPADVLKTLISRTIFAISQEESRYTLNGALFFLKPGMLRMVATDGHRLALVETAKGATITDGEIKALLPRKALSEISSLLNSFPTDTIEFATDQSTLFFRIGSRLLTCRQLSGAFPNYERILPSDLSRCLVIPGAELSRSIQRVSQFSDERANAVRLKMENKQLWISSSRGEAGESEDLLDTLLSGDEGEPVVIGFNSHYLLDFLKVAGSGEVKFHFKAPDSAGEFRISESADAEYKYRYIVMPLRV
jgi:DNA polymerase-3 subunit beta